MSIFKRKSYCINLTFDDNTQNEHKGVKWFKYCGDLFVFQKGDIRHIVNVNKLYSVSYKVEK